MEGIGTERVKGKGCREHTHLENSRGEVLILVIREKIIFLQMYLLCLFLLYNHCKFINVCENLIVANIRVSVA